MAERKTIVALHAVQKVPASGCVVAIGDVAGTQPDDSVVQVLSDPLDNRGEGLPSDAADGIQPLPACVPESVNRNKTLCFRITVSKDSLEVRFRTNGIEQIVEELGSIGAGKQ